MKLRLWWIVFAIALITIVPVKIYFSWINLTDWNKQPIFLAIAGGFILIISVLIFLSKNKLNYKFNLEKNYLLGGLCILLMFCYVWCAYAYFIDNTKYDLWTQPTIITLRAGWAALTFCLMGLTYLLGKNFFAKAQIFVFGAILYYISGVIIFLTIENHNPEIYDVLGKAFLLLFILYHVNNFVEIIEKPLVKRTFIFGLLGIIITFMDDIPKLILHFQNTQTLTQSNIANSTTDIILVIYVLCYLIFYQLQIESYDHLKKSTDLDEIKQT